VGVPQHAGGDIQLWHSLDRAQQECGETQEGPHGPDEQTGALGPPPPPLPPAGHGVHQHTVSVLADGHDQEDADEEVGLDDAVDQAAEERSERPVEFVPDVLCPEGQAQDEHQVRSRQVGQVDFCRVQTPSSHEEDGQHKEVPQQPAEADGEDAGGQHSVQQGPGFPSFVTGCGVRGQGLALVESLELQEGPGRHPR
uniref:Uncharacterized protein n=1 Tax=Bos indicus x Bos taurus TaxID=30522 RepID=A0A4W2CQ85_BOBOX